MLDSADQGSFGSRGARGTSSWLDIGEIGVRDGILIRNPLTLFLLRQRHCDSSTLPISIKP
jgi:hypothetical protein